MAARVQAKEGEGGVRRPEDASLDDESAPQPVFVRLTKAEAEAIDAARGEASRAAFLRSAAMERVALTSPRQGKGGLA